MLLEFLVDNHLVYKNVVTDKEHFSQLSCNETVINTLNNVLYNKVNIDANDENLKYEAITNKAMISNIMIDEAIIKDVTISNATINANKINDTMINNIMINYATAGEANIVKKANNDALLT